MEKSDQQLELMLFRLMTGDSVLAKFVEYNKESRSFLTADPMVIEAYEADGGEFVTLRRYDDFSSSPVFFSDANIVSKTTGITHELKDLYVAKVELYTSVVDPLVQEMVGRETENVKEIIKDALMMAEASTPVMAKNKLH